jgi:alpha-galactosidase
MVRFDYAGKSMLPRLRRRLREGVREETSGPGEKAKPRYNCHYTLELLDLYGVWPTAISHTKEYVPFFQGYGVKPVEPEPLQCFDADVRQVEMDAAWAVTRDFASGKRSTKRFLREVVADHATDIIESMWGGLGNPFYINAFNRGAITNMPDDAFVELRSDVDMHGPRPHPFGEMPRGVLAIQHQVLDTHELTAAAAATGDRALLRRAMLTDPICNNIPDADACIADLMEAERDALPAFWFAKKQARR